jgi:hypothetical protein
MAIRVPVCWPWSGGLSRSLPPCSFWTHDLQLTGESLGRASKGVLGANLAGEESCLAARPHRPLFVVSSRTWFSRSGKHAPPRIFSYSCPLSSYASQGEGSIRGRTRGLDLQDSRPRFGNLAKNGRPDESDCVRFSVMASVLQTPGSGCGRCLPPEQMWGQPPLSCLAGWQKELVNQRVRKKCQGCEDYKRISDP